MICVLLLLTVVCLASWGASNRWWTPRAALLAELKAERLKHAQARKREMDLHREVDWLMHDLARADAVIRQQQAQIKGELKVWRDAEAIVRKACA